MQNRRIPADDHRGMGEYVNEVDSTGNGVRVPATYFVSIQSTQEPAKQRMVQQKISDPLQVFYAFNVTRTYYSTKFDTISEDLKNAGVKDLVKLISLPVSQNKLLLRLENLADVYDGQSATTVDLNKVASALWKSANFFKPVGLGSVTFNEMNLSANRLLSEMESRRILWPTVDDKQKA